MTNNVTVRTPELLFYVTVQLAIQTVILITWAVYDTPHPVSINISTTEKIWLCRSSSSSVQHAFEASLYGTNGILMGFVLFLTWKNRAIDSSYNETSRIAAASWNFVALLAIGLPLVYLPALYGYQFIMRHVLFLLVTTFTLVMLFGPAVLQIAGIRANEVDLNEADKFMTSTLGGMMTGISDSAQSSSLLSNSVVVPVMIEGGIRTWLNRWEIFRVLLFPSMHHLYLVDDDGGRALMYRLSNVSITAAECAQDAAEEAEPGCGGVDGSGGGGGGHGQDTAGGPNAAEGGRNQAGSGGADLILAFKERGKQKTTVRMSFTSQAERAHWHSLLMKAAAASRSKTTSPTGSGGKDFNMNKGTGDHALRGLSPRLRDVVLKTTTDV
ncbi:hypothetical protein HDU86_001829 [Geranomyces michiganensis]|nr:hypothetical protein HDU86_001829 [Geranomyces michiganensis]